MSSYLLAFAAGDMQGITAKTKNGTLVGVYATKAHPASNLEFALDIAVRSIEFYEEYYGVKYPIPQSLHRPAVLFIWCYGKLGPCDLSRNLPFGR